MTHSSRDPFMAVQTAGQDAATSAANARAHPTPAQALAGNYRKPPVRLHGLTIRIEQTYMSERSGESASGQRWSNRMAAVYGEIEGTLGADGDPIDVFVGPYPESTTVYVVNQCGPTGEFDEHKLMFGFVDAAHAVGAYLSSFSHGWNGMHSLLTASVGQIHWWLKHGDKRRALTPDQLPFDGHPAMLKTLWNPEALPLHSSLARVLYDVRTDDAGGLLLDAVTMADIMGDPDVTPGPVLDALVVEVNRMTMKMAQLKRAMESAATDRVKPLDFTISDPVRLRGTMQVAVLFPLADGQSVTVWFHNPDTTPNKLMPLDELISWKWMLNKKDITIVVAPEKGRDLNPREVARRVMRLADRNFDAFARANAKAGERAATEQALDAEIVALEGQLSDLQKQIELAKIEAEAPKPPVVEVSEIERISGILIEAHGWSKASSAWSLEKTYPGLAPAGDLSDGSRTLTAAWWGTDGNRTLALGAGWEDVFALAVGDQEPAAFAAEFDARTEAFVASRRAELNPPAVDPNPEPEPEPEPTAVEPEPAAAEPEQFTHAGRLIYPARVKFGAEVELRWAVQSTENAARVAAGERPIGGDPLASSPEAAKAIAEEMNRQDADAAKRAAEAAELERLAAEREAAAVAASLAGIEEFVAPLSAMDRGRYVQTLNKLVRSGGTPVLLKDFIRARVEAGYKVVNDRMYGLVLRGPEGGFVEQKKITKIGMNFASWLIAQASVAADEGEETGSTGPDREAEPGKTIAAIGDALMLLGWKITPVRKGIAAESDRGTEVVIEPDSTYPDAIEIEGSRAHASAGDDPKVVAENIDLGDFAENTDHLHDGEKVEDEDDPLDGQPLTFVRAIGRLEEGAAKAGMVVAWGNFDATASTGDLFDAVSTDAAEFARPGVICAQIGKDGAVVARASLAADGAVSLYAGTSGAENPLVETTVSGIAASLGILAAGSASTVDPAIVALQVARETAANNEPINREAGNTEQADLEAKTVEAIDTAIEVLSGDQESAPDSAAVPIFARWTEATPEGRRELLAAAGYTDGDQARAFSGTEWADLSEDVREAVLAAVPAAVVEPEPAPVVETETAPVVEPEPAAVEPQPEPETTPVVEPEPEPADPNPQPEPEVTASNDTPAADPARAEAMKFLSGMLNGTVELNDPTLIERLEPIYTTYAGDAEVEALLEKAANAYSDAAIRAAQSALAIK